MADGRTLYVILSANATSYRAALKGAGRDTDEFGDKVELAGRRIDKTGNEIDKLSGRVRLALDAIALIGPAFIPITAVAITAVTGLAAMLGIATAAAGTAVLAFQGVGDTLKAIEKANLDPTAENLAEVHRLMTDLQPAARGFLRELDMMMPALDSIQDAAADGLFPGATDGLRDLRSMIRPIRDMVSELALAGGESFSSTADAFDSKRGREFVKFVSREARPAMADLTAIVGNLAAGLGEMWMNFDPVNDDFSDWLLKQSRAFDDWAQNLDETEGFQDFIDYIRDNGPQVAETMGDIGDMLLQIVEAAAPMGGPALQGLSAFANAVSAIADSPIGPTLFAAASAATLLNRGLQITTSLLQKIGVQSAANGLTGSTGALATMTAGAKTRTSTIRSGASTLRSDVGTMAAGRMTAGAMSGRELDRYTAAAERTKQTLGGVAKAGAGGAAGIAALSVVATEGGRELGITNTAMLGLVGTMAGPWGAAAGATVGALLDIRAAGSEVSEGIDLMHQSMATGDLARYAEEAKAAKAAIGDLNSTSGVGDFLSEAPSKIGLSIKETFSGNLFGGATDGLQEELDIAESEFEDLRLAIGHMAGDTELSLTGMAAVLARSKPAMDALGISVQDLAKGARDGSIIELDNQIRQWQVHADSAAGRTDAFATSVAELGNDAIATADSAAQLSSALEALLAPALTAEEATDAWRQSLKDLRSELNEGAGFKGFSKAAMENRAVTRDYAQTSIERLKALAAVSTTTEEDMARAVGATRKEFIRNGIAAGISREAIIRRANALGLTPKLVRTVFNAVGLTKTELQARALRKAYRDLPDRVRTALVADGIPKTKGQLADLKKKYDLTPKQVRTVAALMDQSAKRGISHLKALLKDLDNTVARPSAQVDVGNAYGQIANLRAALRNIPDELVLVQTRMVGQRAKANDGVRGADGLTVPGQRYPYGDKTLVLAAPGEEIITNRRGEADAFRRDRAAGRIPAYAGGGTVGRRYGSQLADNGRGERVVVVRDRLPDKVTLTVDGRSFTAYVRSHAASVAGEQIEQAGRNGAARDRTMWP